MEKRVKVELIAKTVPVGKLAHLTTQDIIPYTARVSNPDNQMNTETYDKLIRYLLKKVHVSPFEMVDFTFEVETTRDIGRQILRHKSFAFQEFSQRYAVVDIQAFELREARYQDPKNRQSSFKDLKNEKTNSWWAEAQKLVMETIGPIYKAATGVDIAKEQARAILPEGLTPSTMYMKGNVRSWFFYCLVRCHPGTQAEHREIADAVWTLLQIQLPFFKGLNMEKLAIRYQEMFEEILEECYEH